MNMNYYKRWCEIRFYHLAKELYSKSNNFEAFDGLSRTIFFYGGPSPSVIKNIMNEVLTNPKYHPGRNETVVLSYTFKHKVKSTMKLIRMTNKTYYSILEKHFNDPMGIYPKITDLVMLDTVVQFMEAYDEMKGATFA